MDAASIWTHDVGSDFVVMRWRKEPSAIRYELQWRAAGDAEWSTASDKLQSNTVRKRGLHAGADYEFRVRGRDNLGWNEFSAPAAVRTLADGAALPDAPTLRDAGGLDIVVQWPEASGAERYEIQFADPVVGEWSTASDKLKGASVRKKVSPGQQLEARVRAFADGHWGPFSSPSAPMAPANVADCWPRNLGPSLTNALSQQVPTHALANSIVCLLAVASW